MSETKNKHRLRTPPHDRFDYPENHFNLTAAAAVLHKEHSGEKGHKQITLFKNGPTTVALFYFKAGASLPEHSAKGTVIIQCLDGAVGIEAEEQHHTIKAGEMLTLKPGVVHDVVAQKDSDLLLIVHLENGD